MKNPKAARDKAVRKYAKKVRSLDIAVRILSKFVFSLVIMASWDRFSFDCFKLGVYS